MISADLAHLQELPQGFGVPSGFQVEGKVKGVDALVIAFPGPAVVVAGPPRTVTHPGSIVIVEVVLGK